MILLLVACCISGAVISVPVLKVFNNLRGKIKPMRFANYIDLRTTFQRLNGQ